ncbi:MAG: hypothetical protein RM338_24485 [Nostoc sp. DedQUE12a]|nr:hypothetical protein [Nostoc sp. DedQUE12a]
MPNPNSLVISLAYVSRFRAGNQVSPIGRTRTTPKPRDRVNRFRFAFACCQNWEQGYDACL